MAIAVATDPIVASDLAALGRRKGLERQRVLNLMRHEEAIARLAVVAVILALVAWVFWA